MTKKVFYKEYYLSDEDSSLGFRELFFEEAGDTYQSMMINYLTTCELWGGGSEAPFIGEVGEIEITHEEWENLLLNQDLLGIELLPYPEEENA
jgi:hypothetical protein